MQGFWTHPIGDPIGLAREHMAHSFSASKTVNYIAFAQYIEYAFAVWIYYSQWQYTPDAFRTALPMLLLSSAISFFVVPNVISGVKGKASNTAFAI